MTAPGGRTSINGERLSRIARLCAFTLLAVGVIRFWIMPLNSSFFCDEAGSYWEIKDGLGPVLARYSEFPGTPPLYGLILWGATVVGGVHEYVMRLPSVLAMALTLVLLYRLSRDLLHRDSGLPVVAVFLCSRSIIFAATDARPYAFLLLFIVASTLALVNWLNSGSTRYAVLYVLTAGLIPYFHYLALPVWGVQALYAFARVREGSSVRLRSVIGVAAATVLWLIPLLPFLLRITRERQVHTFKLPSPNVRDLAEFLMPSVLTFGVLFGLILAWLALRRLTVEFRMPRISTVLLVAALALVPALGPFTLSVVSPARIFVKRYMIASMVGVSMAVGWGLAQIKPAAARYMVIAALVLTSIGAYGYTRRLWPPHKDENWRDAMAAARKVSGTSRLTLLYKCPFIECTERQVRLPESVSNWVTAPLSLYPAPGRVVPIAISFDDSGSSYLEATAVPDLEREADSSLSPAIRTSISAPG